MSRHADHFDVAVVGAGPGGAVAAKTCAEAGLSTVLLERRALPREKVCSGMLFGRRAQELVAEEFGSIPEDLLLDTLRGVKLLVPGVGDAKIVAETPITWRRDLDFWMVGQAVEQGARLWESTRVCDVSVNGHGCTVTALRGAEEVEVTSRFVIGADGPTSVTRSRVFPEIKLKYTTASRECFRWQEGMERDHSVIVLPQGRYRPNFWINPKGDVFTVEGALRELGSVVGGFLEGYGFVAQEPLWRDGCASRPLSLYERFASDGFTAARGNVLLVGDAAALKIPVSGEGIGTALSSGLSAARSIIASIETGQRVDAIYRRELGPLLDCLARCHVAVDRLRVKEGTEFLTALEEAFAESIIDIEY